ncbi:DUF881 domain-containing protein [Streptomyces sp. TS71-3]|uniref:DUF881 domain-containing protein n=1 Tax=Streptomyces sp. TS71-3 TaxID=2733862 RepID=UPI001B03018A|nr:DUF881 domain-containing protein [Streptomyces sp. TS71-3]GHJ39014.1 hypothetical protein Sm713_46230 [Streptomyces sp. TS71-3]
MSGEHTPGRHVRGDRHGHQLRKELPAEVPSPATGDRPAEGPREPDAERERTPGSRNPNGPGSRTRAVPGPGGAERPAQDRRPAPAPPAEEQRADGEGERSGPRLTGRQLLAKSLWPPRVSRAQLIVAVLLCGLGFGLAIQVASTSDNSALRGARQEDLVRILDELGDRTQRLQDEKQSLQDQRTELENSSDQAEEARKQTAEKERQLGILAGTVAAQGPGITLTIDDPKGTVKADMLLDTIQELRAAGAEAIQVDDVRIVVNSYVTDRDHGGISVDGHKIGKPYRFKVIGKPEDLEPALNIPGGVVQTLEKEQATVSVQHSGRVVVDALRPAKRPDYAQSSSG